MLQTIVNDVLSGVNIVTNAWVGYVKANHVNGGVRWHEVVVHPQSFIHNCHAKINAQKAEGLWMHAKRKLRFQSGISETLFPSYLPDFL
jgi:hypothetical protein